MSSNIYETIIYQLPDLISITLHSCIELIISMYFMFSNKTGAVIKKQSMQIFREIERLQKHSLLLMFYYM